MIGGHFPSSQILEVNDLKERFLVSNFKGFRSWFLDLIALGLCQRKHNECARETKVDTIMEV